MFNRIFITLVVVSVTGVDGSTASEWSYEGATGPENWGLSYPTCGTGQRQSPINIEDSMMALPTSPFLPFSLSGDWNRERPLSIVNNGHTVQATLDGKYRSTGGPLENTTYLAEQFHFHWGVTDDVGSEHTHNGRAFAAEMHIVHYDSSRFRNVSQAMDQDRGLAVFGFFIEIGDENPEMQLIVEAISDLQINNPTNLASSFTLGQLLPANHDTYWTYDGSLTTPPCFESVIWMVFETPITISEAQMFEFRGLGDFPGESPLLHPIINNFRPIQTLRPVTYQGPN